VNIDTTQEKIKMYSSRLLEEVEKRFDWIVLARECLISPELLAGRAKTTKAILLEYITQLFEE
jgi:hypothetical protein